MSKTLTDAEKKVRQDWMGKSGLTLLIWVACAGYLVLAQMNDWDFTTNKQMVIYGASIAAMVICPIVLFFEWRTMRRDMKAVREQQ